MTRPLTPQSASQHRCSCLQHMQYDRAIAVQTWHVFPRLFTLVVALAQGDCLPPTGLRLECRHLGVTHLAPLRQKAALGSVREVVPVVCIYGAQPALGEYMQTYRLNHLWREERCKPPRPHFFMLQVPTEKVVYVLVFMDQQVPDVMQECRDNILLHSMFLACDLCGLQGVLQLRDLLI